MNSNLHPNPRQKSLLRAWVHASQTALFTLSKLHGFSVLKTAVVFLMLLCSLQVQATRYYVKANATGSNDGTSWTNAYTNLGAAINAAAVDDEVWVAQGTYKPGTNRGDSYIIRRNVKLYGGFVGNETVLSQRLLGVAPSILSGDIGTPNDNTDNINNVVRMHGLNDKNGNITSACILDGFIIRDGYASVNRFVGGGLYLYGTSSITAGVECSPTISNCIFVNNYASSGGAIGGYGWYDGNSSPTISNCIFVNNYASSGGAIYFTGQGGISNPTITNCTFYNNTSSSRGQTIDGRYNHIALKNCIIWQNDSYAQNNALTENDGKFTLTNCIVQRLTENDNAYNLEPTNCSSENPLFVNTTDLDGPDNIWGTADDGLRLQGISPAKNGGINSGAPTTDILGQAIVATKKDLGAFENTCNVSMPTASTPQTATTVSNLSASGVGLKWYANEVFGPALSPSTILVNGATYYVSQTVNNCESERLAVVNSNACNAPSKAASSLSFNSLTTTDVSLKWKATTGTNAKSMVIAKANAFINKALITDNIAYTADANFAASGSSTIDGGKVVYVGAGDNAMVTGLSPDTKYHFTIVSFDDCDASNKLYKKDVAEEHYITTTTTNYTNVLGTTGHVVSGFQGVEGNMTSGWPVGESPAKAVDGIINNQSNKYLNFQENNSGFEDKIAAAKKPTRLIIMTTGEATFENRDPKVFKLEAKMDGGSTYTTLLRDSLPFFTGGGLKRHIFEFNNTTAYDVFRFTVENTQGGDVMQLSEVGLYEYIVPCSTPLAAATSLSFNNLSTTAVGLKWKAETGTYAKSMVIAKADGFINKSMIINNIAYAADANFAASGSSSIDGGKVVYVGTGDNVAITGLSANTKYHFTVINFNDCDANTKMYKKDVAEEQYVTTTTANYTNVLGTSGHVITGFQGTLGGTTSGWPTVEAPSKAVDGNTSTKYLNFAENNSGFEDKISAAKKPTRLMITTTGEATFENRDPKVFKLEAKMDGGSTYTMLLRDSLPFYTEGGIKQHLFEFNNTTAYDVFRLTVENTQGADIMQLSEVALYEYVVPCSAPTTPATSLSFNNLSTTAVGLKWKAATGTNVKSMVIAKANGFINKSVITDNTAYTADANFAASSSSTIDGGKVVYIGTGDNVAITGLSADTKYHFTVISLSDCDANTKVYKKDVAEEQFVITSTVNYTSILGTNGHVITGFQGTEGNTTSGWPVAESPAKAVDGITNNQSNKYLNFQEVNSGFEDKIAAAKKPTRLMITTTGETNFTLRDPKVIKLEAKMDGGSTYTTLLRDSLPYYTEGGLKQHIFDFTNTTAFDVFRLTVENTQGADIMQLSEVTLYESCPTAPTTAAIALDFRNIANTSVTAEWNKVNGVKHLIIVKEGSAINAASINDGTVYTANANFAASGSSSIDGGKVVYDGTDDNVSVTGLTADKKYYFTVVTYDACNPSYKKDVVLTRFITTKTMSGLLSSASNITITPANTGSGEGFDKAVDGDTGTKYLNFEENNSTFEVALASATQATRLNITTVNESLVYNNRNPKMVTIEGKNGSSGAYTSVFVGQLSENNAAAIQEHIVEFDNANNYNFYRITFNNIYGGTELQVAEIQLYGGFCQPTNNTTTTTACDSLVWTVNNQTYRTSGTYTHVTTNQDGCINTETLNLTINASTTQTTNAVACDSYKWSVTGQTYTKTGEYKATSQNAAGCTHTEVLNLTLKSTTDTTKVFECINSSYTWSVTGQTYTTAGDYTQTSTNGDNCTHTKVLRLAFGTSTTHAITETACDSFRWTLNDTKYTESGIYTHTVGCHIETLNLTIKKSTEHTVYHTECSRSYVWAVNNEKYLNSGDYKVESLNAAGCKHTEILILQFGQPTFVEDVKTACESYTWFRNNQTYTESGTYENEVVNNSGCTETQTLRLTINKSSSNTTIAAACGTYKWSYNGETYNQTGRYSVFSYNNSGCEHVEILDLTINNPTTESTTITACSGSYTWATNGQTYTTSGTYTYTGLNASGCELNATLILTVFKDRIYVKEGATGKGTTWTDATGNLQAAIDNTCGIKEIAVAIGTFNVPTILINKEVELRGGFIGIEAMPYQRNLTTGKTILSGDNTRRIMEIDVSGASAFAIIGGIIEGFSFENGRTSINGGAIHIKSGADVSIKPTISDCNFIRNDANSGGAIYLDGNGGDAYPEFLRCGFGNNRAYNGGAISGFNAGGLFGSSVKTIPISNCLFVNNIAYDSHAAWVFNKTSVNVENCTFYGNGAESNSITSVAGGSSTMRNCIAWNNETGASFGNVTASNSIGISGNYVDPMFMIENSPYGFDRILGTADDGLRLRACSPAINTGSTIDLMSYGPDVRGGNRILNNDIDMGAYEMNAPLTSAAKSPGTYQSDYVLDDGQWKHYYDCDNNYLLLSLNTTNSGAVIPDNGVKVKVNSVSGAKHYAQGTGFINNPQGAVLMESAWDVNPTTQPTGQVAVRTYYTKESFDAINNEMRSRDIPTLSNESQMFFYKVTDSQMGEFPTVASLTADKIQMIDNGTTPSTSVWKQGTHNSVRYAEYKVTSFSGGGGGAFPPPAVVLPLDLIGFTAYMNQDKTAQVKWVTANEVAVSHFEIEKSRDGLSFETMTTVKAVGRGGNNYHALDKTPFENITYYRLKMIDNDGQFMYSKIVSVKASGAIQKDFMVYPNPTKGSVFVDYPVSISATIGVYNTTGQLLKQVSTAQTLNEINIQELPAGTYFIRLTAGAESVVKSIIKE
jgi:Secretion system C-terminal sorting domain